MQPARAARSPTVMRSSGISAMSFPERLVDPLLGGRASRVFAWSRHDGLLSPCLNPTGGRRLFVYSNILFDYDSRNGRTQPQRTHHGPATDDGNARENPLGSLLRRDHALRQQDPVRRCAQDRARPREPRRACRPHLLPARAFGLWQDHHGQPCHGHPRAYRRRRARARRAGALPHGAQAHRLHAAGRGAVRGHHRRGEPALLRHAQRHAEGRARSRDGRDAGVHAPRG